MSKENLVAYNAVRIIKAVKTADKNGDYFLTESYDTVLGILDFIREELERNYNPKANLKCSCCKEHFTGMHAYDRQINHELKAHKEVCTANAILAVGGLACLMDGISDYKWLYKKTGSQTALALHKLHKRGKDLPFKMIEMYHQEFDDYMDTQDPKRRWHRPLGKTKYPDNIEMVAGRNTIIKETCKAAFKILKGKVGKNDPPTTNE